METDEWIAHVERLCAAHREPAEELFQRALDTKDISEHRLTVSPAPDPEWPESAGRCA
jgi:hypothetical protein